MANEVVFATDAVDETALISLTAALSDGRIAGGQAEFVNASGYPRGEATLDMADSFAAAPDGPIDLYMVRGDVRGGTDNDTSLGYGAITDASAETDPAGLEYVGSFGFPDADEAYRKTIPIELPVSKCKFYIMNNSGQALSYVSNAITLAVKAYSFEPAA